MNTIYYHEWHWLVVSNDYLLRLHSVIIVAILLFLVTLVTTPSTISRSSAQGQ